MPLTILTSIVTSADEGITFDACAPIRELAMPRMLSDGVVINSLSDCGRPSVEPSQSSCIRRASMAGASARACFSTGPSGTTSS